MDVLVTPRELAGTVTVPASKSDVHRALICAALSDKPTEIRSIKSELISVSHDIHATGHCLKVLGAGIETASDHATVTPIPRETLPLANVVLECESSGSTARFMLPLAAACAESATLTGTEQLAARPLGDLMVSMYEHGVRFVPAADDDADSSAQGAVHPRTFGPLGIGGGRATLRSLTLPLRTAGLMQAGEYEIPGDVSSQYVSGLLFALALLSDRDDRESSITLTSPLESAGYVDMTIEWLARFGVTVEPDLGGWIIPGGQRITSPGTVVVEGDWSSGAMLLTLAAYNPRVKVKGLKASSLQPDRVIERILPQWKGEPESREVNVCDWPDLFPVLAVLAASPTRVERGHRLPQTRFTGIDRLRYKESNRVANTAKMLRAAGVHVEEDGGVCTVTALSRRPARKQIELDADQDHRIVMAATLAAHLFERPVLIHGAEAIAKSYPIFFDDYRHLGGCAEEV